MMNTKTPTLHSLAHAAMLIIIMGLLSSYLQLRGRYTDLIDSYAHLQRIARECTDVSNTVSNHVCFHHEESSAATPAVIFKASSRLSSETAVNDRYSQTELSAHKSLSVSISESFFDSKHIPFETSVTLTVDEFGKTDKGESEMEAESTVSSTNEMILSVISYVETTKAKEYGVLKSQNVLKQETVAPAVTPFSRQPSSTLEEQLKKQSKAYSLYSEEKTQRDETMTEPLVISNSGIVVNSLVTSFSAMSLSVSETSRNVQAAAKISSIEKQDFGKTYSDADSYHDIFEDGVIHSTENVGDDYMHNGKSECQSESCDGIDNRLNIQPVPPNVLSALNNVDVDENDRSNINKLLQQVENDEVQTLIQKGTSAFCGSSDSEGSYTCHFENLCYKVAEHDFIFLKGEQSIIERQVSLRNIDTGDLFDINLSTVPDHNAFRFSPVFIPSEKLSRFPSVSFLRGKSFIIHRFKPDNVMHVLHDDILPLYHTLHSLGLISGYQKPDITLLFADNFDIGEYANFYKSFSTEMPLSLRHLNQTADIVCFSDTYVGLSDSTLWYQYGFFKLQGPLTLNGSNLLLNIRCAIKYLTRHFHYNCTFCANRNYLVLLSRKDNRLILNEGDLMMSVARSTKLKVMSVSMETHGMEEIISMVNNSRGIIGMHGSLLSFLIFLQPGSFVIELFPYAVNPLKYTPFKTFCDLPGSDIIYKSWVNQDRHKSIPHPDWPTEMGGIHHLSHDTQRVITDQTDVPDHLCCEDPSWLYHIYQDTEVDIEAVTSLTNAALTEASTLQVNSKTAKRLVTNFPVIPGPVKDLVCKATDQIIESNLDIKYLLLWQLPWNMEFLEYDILEYQLIISEDGNDESFNIDLPYNVTFYSLQPTSQKPQTVYNVWVRVTVDKSLNGPYVFVMCRNHV